MPTRVVFEATGAYHRSFERTFSGKLPLVKVNPLQARRFAQACGTRVKTDAVDARMLASFGNALTLEPDHPVDGKQFELKELFSSRGALIKDRTRLTNRLQYAKPCSREATDQSADRSDNASVESAAARHQHKSARLPRPSQSQHDPSVYSGHW